MFDEIWLDCPECKKENSSSVQFKPGSGISGILDKIPDSLKLESIGSVTQCNNCGTLLKIAGWPPLLEQTHSLYFVQVCGFTFRFRSLKDIENTLKFYQQKPFPSSRRPGRFIFFEPIGKYQSQTDRLPMYLKEESKRKKL